MSDEDFAIVLAKNYNITPEQAHILSAKIDEFILEIGVRKSEHGYIGDYTFAVFTEDEGGEIESTHFISRPCWGEMRKYSKGRYKESLYPKDCVGDDTIMPNDLNIRFPEGRPVCVVFLGQRNVEYNLESLNKWSPYRNHIPFMLWSKVTKLESGRSLWATPAKDLDPTSFVNFLRYANRDKAVTTGLREDWIHFCLRLCRKSGENRNPDFDKIVNAQPNVFSETLENRGDYSRKFREFLFSDVTEIKEFCQYGSPIFIEGQRHRPYQDNRKVSDKELLEMIDQAMPD